MVVWWTWDGREPSGDAIAKRDGTGEQLATHLSLSSVARDGNKEKWTDHARARAASPRQEVGELEERVGKRRACQPGSLADESAFLPPLTKCTAAANEPILEESKVAAFPFVHS